MTYRKPTHRRLVLVSVLLATAAGTVRADQRADDATAREQGLIAILQAADSPKAEKAITCKKLAVFGSKDAVSALAPLLEDEELISWARIALEVIPGPEADAALRNALGKLKGRSLAGVVNSLGVRRDALAVPALVGLLKDSDNLVATSAAASLGKIGDEGATKALRQTMATGPDSIRSAAAEGCIYAAEQRLAGGKSAEAATIYDEVRAADVPTQRKIEATRGAILARGLDGIGLLVEQLRSADKKYFQIGLMTARELPGQQVADAIAEEMVKATPERGALLLLVLAARGDSVASPAVLQAAKEGPAPTRIAAIKVLGGGGNVTCVPTLLDIMAGEDADVALAAQAALAGWPGADINGQISERIATSRGKSLLPIIQLIGKRQIDATDDLVKLLEGDDAAIRQAALAALGETIAQSDLAVLITRVAKPKKAEDAPAAERALKAACIRMPDGEACADTLVAALSGEPVGTQVKFLEVLGAMDNPRSLAALATAAKSGKEELTDASTRLLGGTISLDAAPVILDLASTLPDGKYKIRAIRGYIRLVRQFNMNERDRVRMCAIALDAADRRDERKMVLEVMERYPSIDMLRLAVDLAKDSELKAEAAGVALVIAQNISGGSVDVQKLLAQIGHDPVKIEIVKAEYGAGGKGKDVTEILRKHVRGFPLIVLPSGSYNSALGGDPAQGIVKQLRIQYRMNDKPGEVVLAEDATIMLPVPK
ncbi:MAG: HEAT repeat domain-containing protein [Planctomycetes bacterium]|nr:HEAT repeat domain-containing protein [Planctomycetota bacterium]